MSKTKHLLAVFLIAELVGFAQNHYTYVDTFAVIRPPSDSLTTKIDTIGFGLAEYEIELPDSYNYLISLGEKELAEQMLKNYFTKSKWYRVKLYNSANSN